jgi:hypothetical protein
LRPRDPKGGLLQRFLTHGPRDASGKESVSDAEAIEAVHFICGQVVNSFQGKLAEMLASGLDQPAQHVVEPSAMTRVELGTEALAGACPSLEARTLLPRTESLPFKGRRRNVVT